MPYQIKTIAGKECLLRVEENTQEDIVESLRLLFLSEDIFESESLLWLPETNSQSKKITLLITSLFSLYALKDWNDPICLYHRIAIGLLNAALKKATYDDFKEYIIKELNQEILSGKAFNAEDYPPIYTTLYYGEHYDRAWYDDEMRAFDAQQQPINNLYSRSIHNITNIRVGDRQYTTTELQQLNQAVIYQLEWFRQLDVAFSSPQACYHEGPGNVKKYPTPGDMHHQRAVGAYFSFLNDAKSVTAWKLRKYGINGTNFRWITDNRAQIDRDCASLPKSYSTTTCTSRSAPLFIGFESKIYHYTTPTAFDPYIPTTSRIETAYKYAINDGIEAWDMPLDTNLFKKREVVGKLYIFLFELGEFRTFLKQRKMLSTFDEMSYMREHIGFRRLPEDEYSFRSQIPLKNIAGKIIIKKENDVQEIEEQSSVIVTEKTKKHGGFYVYLLPDSTLSLYPPGEKGDAYKVSISDVRDEVMRQKETPENTPEKIALRNRQLTLESSLSKKSTSGERKVFSPESPAFFAKQIQVAAVETVSPQKPKQLWPESTIEESFIDMICAFSKMQFFQDSADDHRLFGLQITDVPYQVGNCLFEAIAYFVSGRSAHQLRTMAVEHIGKDNELRERLTALASTANNTIRNHTGEDVLYTSLEGYLDVMAENQTWGTLIEVVALSRALGRRIVILTPNNQYDQIIEADGYLASETIFINYEGDNHYRPLFIPTGETAQRILARIRHRIEQRSEQNTLRFAA